MDMIAAYQEEVRDKCPEAEAVYDLFHGVARYGREVIDRVTLLNSTMNWTSSQSLYSWARYQLE
jgi:transposase